jgi:hypothetical protein
MVTRSGQIFEVTSLPNSQILNVFRYIYGGVPVTSNVSNKQYSKQLAGCSKNVHGLFHTGGDEGEIIVKRERQFSKPHSNKVHGISHADDVYVVKVPGKQFSKHLKGFSKNVHGMDHTHWGSTATWVVNVNSSSNPPPPPPAPQIIRAGCQPTSNSSNPAPQANPSRYSSPQRSNQETAQLVYQVALRILR